MKRRISGLALALMLLISLLSAPAAAATQGGVTGALIVNGVDVFTAPDPADVLGDGTVSFDRDSGVLTLSDAKLTQGVSDPDRAFAEHPAIFFEGRLTLQIRGVNTIGTGTDFVMGKALCNNAIVGDELIVTGSPHALLELSGMVQLQSYTQKSGNVVIQMENDHPQIAKWAMYVNDAIRVEGGMLSAATTGQNRCGAIAMDTLNLLGGPGVRFSEGDAGLQRTVPKLSFSGVGFVTSKNTVLIEQAKQGIAHESRQSIELGGASAELPAYALADAQGNLTNYVRLRDLAELLNGSAAQFDVLWTAERGIDIQPRSPYAHPNGSEGKAPFTGDQTYYLYEADTVVEGEPCTLAAFWLVDGEGGGHTYYQLRDLGRALGFNVGWSAGRGIFIEPEKRYTDAD